MPHTKNIHATVYRLVRCHLSSHGTDVSHVPQQLNSRQIGEFCGHHVKSLLGSLMLSSVHSTIITTSTLINQAGSYYVITNCYLIGIEASYIPLLNDIIVITFDLGSTLVSFNSNDIILVMGYY